MDHMSEFEIYAAFNEIISQSYTPAERTKIDTLVRLLTD